MSLELLKILKISLYALNQEAWHKNTLIAVEQSLDELLSYPQYKNNILLSAMRYSSLSSGKRIRPLLCIASGELSNAKLQNTLIIGSAIELIHCFSLIHDDLPIMDNDDLRRGRATNHKVYGDAIALLAGDALHAHSFAILSSNLLDIAASQKLNIISLLSEAIGINGMVGGQAMDWLNTGCDIKIEQLELMHSLKTGALLKCAILAGYIAGNNFQLDIFEKLQVIAEKIGLLFQIIDDIIDFTESTETLGKTANKDQSQAKATYVTLFGLDRAMVCASDLYAKISQLIKICPNSEILAFLALQIYARNS